jgi:hypothetical protein
VFRTCHFQHTPFQYRCITLFLACVASPTAALVLKFMELVMLYCLLACNY